MAMCIEQVELAQSCHAMVHTDLDALQERHEGVIQRIVNLEETLFRDKEKTFQLKGDVKARSFELIGCWGRG